jgi:predicted kinase
MLTIDQNIDPEALLSTLEPFFPLVSEMADTEQDPVWHAEGNVRIHTRMVLEHAKRHWASVAPVHRVAFMLGCALHDVGKARTTKRQWRPKEGDGGRECVVSPRHAVVGRSYLYPRMHRLSARLTMQQADQICALVGYHHHLRAALKLHGVDGFSESPRMTAGEQARMWALARVGDLQRLHALETCDTLGRTSLGGVPNRTDADRVWWLRWFKDVATFHDVWDGVPFGGWREHFETAFAGEDPELIDAALAKATYDFGRKTISSAEEGVARAEHWRTGYPTLVVLCGPPGSGKSALASRYEHVVSFDTIRSDVAGGRQGRDANDQVRLEAYKRVRAHLAEDHTVVVEAPLITRDERRSVLSIGQKHRAATHVIAFATDPETLRDRNGSLAQPASALGLERAIAGFDFPAETEAHRMSVVDAWGERELGRV